MRPVRPTRIAAWAAAGTLAAATVGGIAYAASADTPSTTATGTGSASATAAHRAPARNWLLRRLEHGELTIRVNGGNRAIDVQRGDVTGVTATSITVKSVDGFTAYYTVNANTKIRKDGKPAGISDVRTNDRVVVVATGGKATRIADRGPKPTASQPAS